mmetsp:Transcript_28861/g.69782  ORF Transcript_28861/g.69782 Transcript_28861/m.69782 type:complete len:256 (-) Transcript_28861:6-773(-)
MVSSCAPSCKCRTTRASTCSPHASQTTRAAPSCWVTFTKNQITCLSTTGSPLDTNGATAPISGLAASTWCVPWVSTFINRAISCNPSRALLSVAPRCANCANKPGRPGWFRIASRGSEPVPAKLRRATNPCTLNRSSVACTSWTNAGTAPALSTSTATTGRHARLLPNAQAASSTTSGTEQPSNGMSFAVACSRWGTSPDTSPREEPMARIPARTASSSADSTRATTAWCTAFSTRFELAMAGHTDDRSKHSFVP